VAAYVHVSAATANSAPIEFDRMNPAAGGTALCVVAAGNAVRVVACLVAGADAGAVAGELSPKMTGWSAGVKTAADFDPLKVPGVNTGADLELEMRKSLAAACVVASGALTGAGAVATVVVGDPSPTRTRATFEL
jgi:hypothetical protein